MTYDARSQWAAFDQVLHWINEQDEQTLNKSDLYRAVMAMRPIRDRPLPEEPTMTSTPLDVFITHKELVAEVDACGGQRGFSRKYGIPRTTLQDRLAKLREDDLYKHRPAPEACKVGQGIGRRRYLISSAQDSTRVHESFLKNLEAYADWLEQDAPCEIIIAGFTYNKSLFEDHGKKTPYFHERVRPYMRNERLRLCEGLDFCGEMNTLPTAVTPLAGFETYTRHRSAVFPHAKVQLVSVPTQKHLPAKFNYTTGACTLPNYVPKRAGIKASFHHVIAAVIVEIDADEEFFVRHLIADKETGAFYDLDRHVANGKVTTGHAVDCLTPGDLHIAQIDPQVSKATFGFYPNGKGWEFGSLDGTIIGELKPRHIFAHDGTDFRARNSHEIRDPHARFKRFMERNESVREELTQDAMFLTTLSDRAKSWGGSLHSVDSNHNNQLLRWIKSTTHHDDPVNALFYLECATAVYRAMEQGIDDFDVYAHVMKNGLSDLWSCDDVNFLNVDASFVVNGVEHANHGHHGANGAKGSIHAFVRGGSKTTSGHTHSAAILDGAYVAGTSSKLDLGYNVGLSSWSNSHVLQYFDGHRTIITLKGDRWKI